MIKVRNRVKNRPKAIGMRPKGPLNDSTISSSRVLSEDSANLAILSIR